MLFLELLRDVIDAFENETLKPLERVYKIWYSVFILRIWLEYVSSKTGLVLGKNFITMNCYSCIELNAHSLLLILVHLNKIQKPQSFITHMFESQPCENFFRQVRSFTSTYSTVVNCSVKELLGRIKKIHLQNDIAQKSVFNFPRIKILNELMGDIVLPTEKEIVDHVERAKRDAIKSATEIGLLKNRRTRSLKLECKIPLIQPRPPKPQEHITKVLAPVQIKTMNLKNFADKFKDQNILDQSPYVRLFIEEKEFVLKKTSLCWLLRSEYSKLSSDRLIRVRANK